MPAAGGGGLHGFDKKNPLLDTRIPFCPFDLDVSGTFSKNFSSLALTAWEGRFVEYLEEKTHGLT